MPARKLILAALAVAAVAFATLPTDAAPPANVTLRIATQAPEGTVWLDALKDIQKEVDKSTKGRVALQYFPNGSQGDEKAVIERIQAGVIHGGLFTGIGLGEILPKVRILEMPFLYRNNDELEAVKKALEPEFTKGFEEKGFVLLGWSEVGWAYIFSKVEAKDLAGLRQRKIWMWQGDPLAEKTFKVFGMAGTPLPLTDVLTSLETGMIDSVYNSPYGLVGLQWHRNIKFMSRMTVGHGTGALLVAKTEFEKIPAGPRATIAQIARKRLDELNPQVAKKNDETTAELQKNGTQVIPIPEDELPEYIKLGEQVADQLVGVLYDKELLEKVRKILAERRAAAGGK